MLANGEHAAEEPEASSGRGGWPCQSAWNPRDLSGRRAAAHPRHQRPLLHRNHASSGCFRMYREDVEELYDMVQPGTRVIVQRQSDRVEPSAAPLSKLQLARG
ncbi:hypothetical protein AMC78_CH02581 [Rhizobium phaseoli]|nr:hypothetical protein AMC78_CH02581 [Rhizobium phaseoli]